MLYLSDYIVSEGHPQRTLTWCYNYNVMNGLTALAIREGLMLATQRGFQNFILESDSHSTLFKGSHFNHWIHVPRQANGTAHRLARFALLSSSNSNWDRVLPDLISYLLFEESVM
ncbi:hypothetical protein DVH24_021720 [Malus domestica]|uniref:Uncharacterized protein n=1 Tax=Malus domestica TaxID=3750 RepID=A0A498JVK5_MALDO|nr:hypothetical protein DVH24_021720 [Malus domestica]